jgi:hypothetical protein
MELHRFSNKIFRKVKYLMSLDDNIGSTPFFMHGRTPLKITYQKSRVDIVNFFLYYDVDMINITSYSSFY